MDVPSPYWNSENPLLVIHVRNIQDLESLSSTAERPRSFLSVKEGVRGADPMTSGHSRRLLEALTMRENTGKAGRVEPV